MTFTDRPLGRLLRTECDTCGTTQRGTPKALLAWKRAHQRTCYTLPRRTP